MRMPALRHENGLPLATALVVLGCGSLMARGAEDAAKPAAAGGFSPRSGRVLRDAGPAGPRRVVRPLPRREEAVVGPAAGLAPAVLKGGDRARAGPRRPERAS